MGLSRRKFTREFKLDAIERLESGTSVATVALTVRWSSGPRGSSRAKSLPHPKHGGRIFCDVFNPDVL